jgi:hypothetical protein
MGTAADATGRRSLTRLQQSGLAFAQGSDHELAVFKLRPFQRHADTAFLQLLPDGKAWEFVASTDL